MDHRTQTVLAKVHEKGKNYKGFFLKLSCWLVTHTGQYYTYLKHQPRKFQQKNLLSGMFLKWLIIHSY
jgi:hypothetical protein